MGTRLTSTVRPATTNTPEVSQKKREKKSKTEPVVSPPAPTQIPASTTTRDVYDAGPALVPHEPERPRFNFLGRTSPNFGTLNPLAGISEEEETVTTPPPATENETPTVPVETVPSETETPKK